MKSGIFTSDRLFGFYFTEKTGGLNIFLHEYSPHPMMNSNVFGAIEIKKALLKSLSKVDSAETLSILGGDEGIRTPDLYVANVPLSHLSYIPTRHINLY